ncbi:MAG: nucleotidyl transferase AbiEii/AbiGii toxin family protein [Pseudomonadota bacterium]
MNHGFLSVIAATPENRRGLFLATANRLGTPLQNVEKDFWVCWVLDLLFNGKETIEPRLLFKGGTSLSKAYGLISRFSEDIDITVFREDIGQDIEIADLEKLSGKQQRNRLDALKQACQSYIQGALKERLNRQIKTVFREVGTPLTEDMVILDSADPDRQSLLVCYPSAMADERYFGFGQHHANFNDGRFADLYVKPTIKIEAGAKSALDPHRQRLIKPYVANEIATVDLTVQGVVTIDAERTFWDKILILHGLRRWYDIRGQLRQQGHRISRHYYDIYQLLQSEVGERAKKDRTLANHCTRHAQMFFNSTDLDLKSAYPGSFAITPTLAMAEVLRRDYQAMAGMIFNEVPDFAIVMNALEQLEQQINQTSD